MTDSLPSLVDQDMPCHDANKETDQQHEGREEANYHASVWSLVINNNVERHWERVKLRKGKKKKKNDWGRLTPGRAQVCCVCVCVYRHGWIVG
jgi:hypothetical protein